MRTLTGDCTSSEDVAEAWSLSPSDPIFKSSCTTSGHGNRGRAGEPGHPQCHNATCRAPSLITPRGVYNSPESPKGRPGQVRAGGRGRGSSLTVEHPVRGGCCDCGWPSPKWASTGRGSQRPQEGGPKLNRWQEAGGDYCRGQKGRGRLGAAEGAGGPSPLPPEAGHEAKERRR